MEQWYEVPREAGYARKGRVMTKLTPAQIGLLIHESPEAFWPVGVRIAGTPPRDVTPPDVKRRIIEWLDVAVAIVYAESGGNPAAKSSISSATGLWQIMVSVHEDKIKQAQQMVISQRQMRSGTPGITHPLVNTTVAAMVYRDAGKKWTPWEVYTLPKTDKRSYVHHLGHGKQAYDGVYNNANIERGINELLAEYDRGQSLAEAAALTMPLASIAPGIAADAFKFLQQAGMTVGAFVLGVLLVILGAWFLLSQTKVGTAIKSATPIGKAAKLLK